jgi:SelR domain
LTPDQYYVLRKEGTETPGASELNFVKEPGTFVCAGCGSPLFVTDAKYDSGTGWPRLSRLRPLIWIPTSNCSSHGQNARALNVVATWGMYLRVRLNDLARLLNVSPHLAISNTFFRPSFYQTDQNRLDNDTV